MTTTTPTLRQLGAREAAKRDRRRAAAARRRGWHATADAYLALAVALEAL